MKPGWRFGLQSGAMLCALAAAVFAGLAVTGVPALADIDVSINIGNAPPPPPIVFRARPHERIYPGERVYVVEDDGVGDNDCFRYGRYYWVFREGYWYRSAGWRGRWVVVHPRSVPSVFYRLPQERWKHRPNGPPDFRRRGDDRPGHGRREDRREDRRGDRDRK